ncbi:MAG: ABC transporter permease, partial [Bacteroidales bacterium]
MLRYYVKHALRVIYRDKFHSVLNVIGLSIGIACGIIVLLYVQNELTYERHHIKKERIYRYGVNMTIGGVNSSQTTCNAAVGPLLKDYMPGIESFVRIGKPGEIMIKHNRDAYYEEDIFWADSSLFHVFTHQFISGDPATCLKNINSIVLTEELAGKIFGDADPMDKTVEIENQGLFTVTGVIKDLPDNSYLMFDGLMSFSTLYHDQDIADVYNPRRLGGNMFFELYFLFKEDFRREDFYSQFQAFYDENLAEYDRIQYKAIAEPVKDIHLRSEITTRESDVFRRLLYGLSSIGIFILVLACINYINLATSRAEGRAKEIGLKKVTGAGKKQLITQFLGESMVLSVISLLLGLGIAEVIFVFTPLNEVFDKDLQIDFFHNPVLAVGSIGLTIIVGILSGLYPSFYLSRILPVKALRGDAKEASHKFGFRNILVIFQFAISIGAVALTLLMNQQLKYVRSKDLGFDREEVLLISVRDEKIRGKMSAYREVINTHHGVVRSSFSSTTPGYGISGWAFLWESNTGEMERHANRELYADRDYF